jgi:DNA topoisomerase IA
MDMILIIVESPTKARSIAQYARGAFACVFGLLTGVI